MSASMPAIVILSDAALLVAQRIQSVAGGDIHGASSRVTKTDVSFEHAASHLQALFLDARPIIAVMAAGAVIRLLAPVLADKQSEPPVIAVADDGSAVVPLLGGHHGANDMARKIAAEFSVKPAITTAGDVRFGVALDQPPPGYRMDNPERAKTAMASLIAGEKACMIGKADWLSQSDLPLAGDGMVRIIVSPEARSGGIEGLVYHPQVLALGIGCERGTEPSEAIALADKALAEAGLAKEAVGVVVSIDLKADEAAIHAVANHFGVTARFFDATTLEAETPRLANPSDVVFAEVGCHGVAEGAALAAAGPEATLMVRKQKSKRATCAIAQAPSPIVDLPGRARGTLFVVGIGPGAEAWRSPEVSRMIRRSTDLVGYSLYLDLLGRLAKDKVRHDFDLGAEEDRVRHAMELAGEGRDVALVCSGDAGIYAMATLVFELFDKGGISDAARRIAVEVSPGISALQAAAARAGAPLGHDFCTISLSDLLTPWQDIQRRVKAAGEGDFVIAFYNPVSKKRRTQLAWARDELLNHRPADTPVILATNLGRDGEAVRVVPLGTLDIDEVDMLTVVIVGSSDSRVTRTGDGKSWVYTPRGYSGKQDTRMAS